MQATRELPTPRDFDRSRLFTRAVPMALILGASLAGAGPASAAVQQTTLSNLDATDSIALGDDEATSSTAVIAPAYGQEVQILVTPPDANPADFGTVNDPRDVVTASNTNAPKQTTSKVAPANGATVKVLSETPVAASAPVSAPALGSVDATSASSTLVAAASASPTFWGPYPDQICSSLGCVFWKGKLYSGMYQENDGYYYRWWSEPGHYGRTSNPICAQSWNTDFSMSVNYCSARGNFSTTGFYNSANWQVIAGHGLKQRSYSKYLHRHAHTVEGCSHTGFPIICPQQSSWLTSGTG
jgi:hypothetical protein